MNVSQIKNSDLDIDLPNAKLAYTIIQSLLDNQEALSDLLALMAHKNISKPNANSKIQNCRLKNLQKS
jgi:hypothetical protein